jgi:outer membrane autotransporter protein
MPGRPQIVAASVLAALLSVAWNTGAIAQTFIPQGPAPHFGPTPIVQSGDAPPNGTSAGAIQAIITDPVNANAMYIGAVNGGVWATRNGGATWTPLSDNQRSLSIASLATDPTSSNVLVAGTGVTSSSNLGGPRIGLLYSSNGGTSWSELNQGLPATSIVGVAARGSTILAAASEPLRQAAAGGLYRSTNAGASFQAVTFGSGIGNVAVTSLAADPGNRNNFYAVVSSTNAGNNGVWLSGNTGQTWGAAPVLAIPTGQTARLATGPNGSVVAGLYTTFNNNSGGDLQKLMLSKDNGQTWTQLSIPSATAYPGDNSNRFLALAIDPNNPNVVYVGGTDISANGADTLAAFRVVLSANGTSVVEPLTLDGTANGSTAHPDARAFSFDASGRLVLVGDGGVYVRTLPQGNRGAWTGLNTSTLQVTEAYAVAYDAVSKRLVSSSQDTGTAYQRERGGTLYTAIGGGDGHNAAAVNDRTRSDQSALYTSSQWLSSLTRWTVDARGNVVADTCFTTTGGCLPSTNKTGRIDGFQPTDFTAPCNILPGGCLPSASKLVLNKTDPTMIAIGTNYIYTTTDANAASDRLVLTTLGTPFATITPGGNNEITALAYGTNDNPNALIAGGNNGRLFLSTTGAAGSLQPTAYAGGTPTSVVFDNRAAARFFAVDQTNLWGTTNAGASFTNLTSNLAALNIALPTSLEFISNNGVNALLVGGVSSVVNGQSPLAVADSDPAGNLANWRPFGFGLPNTFIYQMTYNPTVDVLAMSAFGRGAWVLYDTTTWFPTARVLRFGLADNDSAPSDSILTNGVYAARELEKVGTGILTIGGTTRYSGATIVRRGTLVANGNLTSSSGVFIDRDATLRGTGLLPSTVVSGTVAPGNSIGTLTVNGNFVQNAGSVYQVEANNAGQSDRINVSGSATINGGTVQVLAQPGTYNRGTTYTILSASGGLSGTYAGVTSNFAFLRPFLGYDANNVYLSLLLGSFAGGAQTSNQYAVGSALDQASGNATGDFGNVLNALAGLSTAQAPAALDAISGQPWADFGTTNTQGASLFMRAVGQQMAVARGAAGGGQRQALAQACEVENCDAASPWGAWTSALGGLGSVAADGNASTLTYNFGGVAAGLDYRLDPRFLLGFGAGYTAGNQWVNGFQGRASTDSVFATVYGSFTRGAFYADGLAGYAYSTNQLQRQISVPGLQPRTANGSAAANQALGQVETGYKVGIYAPALATVTPFARLQASSVTQNGFSEWGANALSLNVAQQTTNSLRSTLGVDLAGAIGLGDTKKLDLALRLGWLHEYAGIGRPITAAFAGAPSTAFTVYGATPQRDSAVIGFSVMTAIAEAAQLYLRYDGEIGNANDNHALNVGVRFTW